MGIQYRFIRELGRGGFGEVRLAARVDTGERVAIKLLHNINAEALNRFRREIRLLAEQIDNRFVVNVLQHNLNNSPPFFVMEYCEGGSLRPSVGRLEWKNAASVLGCAVQGLEGIHRVGGYHRDIKPDNLLLAKDGKDGQGKDVWVIKLSDFGLGRTPNLLSSTMTNSPRGTLAYMAPELFTGEIYTCAADVYSLGITVIELMTGRRDRNALSEEIGQIPSEFVSLLKKMTDSVPQKRPGIRATSQLLSAILRNVESQPPKQSNGSGWLWGGAALLLALLAAGDDKQWDARVGRYRGTDGKFRAD